MKALENGERWRVITGDCRAVFVEMSERSVDHTIMDPPYDEQTHNGARTGNGGDKILGIDFVPLADIDGLVDAVIKISERWCLAFCTDAMIGDYKRAAKNRWIRGGIWHKPDAMPQMTGDRPATFGEAVAIMHREGRKRWNGGGHPAFWSFPIERRDRVHPTQKPLQLMMKLVEQFTDPDDLVFDPFCGSGTTGVACLRLGRRFLGIEIDPKYAALARERLSAESAGGLSLRAARAGQVSLL